LSGVATPETGSSVKAAAIELALTSSLPLLAKLRMFSVESFSLGSVAAARYPIANTVPTSEADEDDQQDRKKLFDEAKHLQGPPSIDLPERKCQTAIGGAALRAMSDGADFLKTRVSKNIEAPTAHIRDDALTAGRLVEECLWEAQEENLSAAEVTETAGGNLLALMVSELNRAAPQIDDKRE
jgi:hypothetical protein